MIKYFTHTAYIGLGSNKGDRFSYLQNAVNEINNLSNTLVFKTSSVYLTKPFGITEQNDFYNAVIIISTDLSFKEIHINLKNIEKKLGRSYSDKFGPREIDLDLLFFDDIIYKDECLIIPHYAISERDFVLIPLKEIANDYFHPVLQQKISDICINEKEKFVKQKLEEKILINNLNL